MANIEIFTSIRQLIQTDDQQLIFTLCYYDEGNQCNYKKNSWDYFKFMITEDHKMTMPDLQK